MIDMGQEFPILRSLGQRVRWARERAGMTQKELSDALRLDQTAISMLERDKVKNPRKITDIAAILAVPPAWLRFGVDNIESLTEDNVQALFDLQNLAPEDQEAVRALIYRLASN